MGVRTTRSRDIFDLEGFAVGTSTTQNKNSCKTAAVMSLLGRGPAAVAAEPAQPPQAQDIETITGEILRLKQTGGEAIIGIGQWLIKAKAVLPRGEWLPWLEDRVEFSERTAQGFMQIARKYTNPQTLADLGASKALMLLALPDETRDEFIASPHMVDGEEKTVAAMSTRELKAVMKERDEARKAAEQAKAEQAAADAAREKMSADMALANERIAGLNAEVEKRSAEASEAQEAAARLEQELEELRAQPRDVAVEVDTAAIEAARKEAETVMQAKLDKAKAAQAKAEAGRKAAEDARTAAQKELEQARADAQAALEKAVAEGQALREQAERERKKAALASNEDLVLFRTLFDQAQKLVDELGKLLKTLRNKDPEKAQGLSRALLALADKIKEVAQG